MARNGTIGSLFAHASLLVHESATNIAPTMCRETQRCFMNSAIVGEPHSVSGGVRHSDPPWTVPRHRSLDKMSLKTQ